MAGDDGRRLEVKRVSAHLTVTVDLAGAQRVHGEQTAVELIRNLQNFGLELRRQVLNDPWLQEFISVRHFADVGEREA